MGGRTLPAFAQVNAQLWANVTLNWLKSPTLTYELDFEPKVLLTRPEGEPGWNNIDVSPNAEYAWKPWLGLSADGTIGTTHQTDGIRTLELSPRVGARFHLSWSIWARVTSSCRGDACWCGISCEWNGAI